MNPGSFLPRLPLCISVGALLATIVACTTVPDTGRRQFNVLSPSQESQLGLSEFAKYKNSKPISRNSAYNAQVQRVARRITPVIPLENPQWEFVVFEDDTPNAFALPGGKVGVHTGLFQISRTDAGLAAVLGHEIAHVYARHSGERMSAGLLAGGAAALAAIMTRDASDTNQRAAVGATAALSTLGVLKFSRNQEIEADQLGALYMARAGYDPRESIGVWERFASYKEAKGGARLPQWLSTHPVDAARIQKLNEFMPRALGEYRAATGN